MNTPLMRCGCQGSAIDKKGNRVCPVHYGFTADAEIVAEAINLIGRFAHCSYGLHARVPSSTDLAFFKYQPDKPEDTYYCGCYGWE